MREMKWLPRSSTTFFDAELLLQKPQAVRWGAVERHMTVMQNLELGDSGLELIEMAPASVQHTSPCWLCIVALDWEAVAARHLLRAQKTATP